MAARLTDEQKKKIIADYVELGSYNAVSRKNGVPVTTVRRVCSQNSETKQKVIDKKRENTKSILEHMEGKRDIVNEIITKGLDVLNDPEKLKEASPNQITTALGTLIDKFIPVDKGVQEEQVFELPARVIGKAFVDINRQIVPNKSYVLKGGRGALKSSYISMKIVELLINNPGIHACAVRKVGATLRDSVYAQIKWAISELGLTDRFKFTLSPLEITLKDTGQVIYFRGCDDPIKLKSIKPAFGYIGILWKEEKDQLAGPAEERSVNQSVLRGGDIAYDFSSYNPPRSRSNWVNKELLVPDENRVVHTSSYLDAPAEWLGKKFLDDAEHLKEVNPAAYEHEYCGNPNGDGGNVFEYIEVREITDEEISHMDRIFQGVDWGWYPDQYAFLRTYYDSAREKIYLIDENYVNKQSNTETGQWILDHGYDDYLITCDSAENKSVNDYRDMGITAKGAVKGPGSVEYGFKWLQNRTIVIDPKRTPAAYNEITNYEYDKDKDGNVISGYPDRDDHAISALRYAYEPLFIRRGSNA